MSKRVHIGLLAGLMLAPAGADAQVACLPIDRIDLRGADLLTPQELASHVTAYEGKCLGLAELDQILETLTLAYVDRGYVLSRAYLPEQDLSDRVLEVAIVEGQLSEVQINGTSNPPLSAMVFPRMRGAPVNLRDVEQGLEQLHRIPRTQAQMEFVPGEQAGDSELHVEMEQSNPFGLSFSSKNQGVSPDARWISTVSADAGNLFGLGETLRLSYTKNLDQTPFSFGYAGDGNEESSASLRLPYGRWGFELAYEGSSYRSTIPGAISPISVSGYTETLSLQADAVLFRDEARKTKLTLLLKRRENANFIQDARIGLSSRVLSSLRVSLGHTTPFWGGQLDGTVFVEQGLRAFGAEDAGSRPVGFPNAQYTLAGIDASFTKPLQVGAHQLTWTSDLSTQFSADQLYGSEQFSIGGVSTVRGTRIALATGSSGGTWRNELEYKLPTPVFGRGQLQLYGGIDLGWVMSNPALGIPGGSATGGALGARIGHRGMSVDLSYQQVLAVSDGLQKPGGEWMFEAAYRF